MTDHRSHDLASALSQAVARMEQRGALRNPAEAEVAPRRVSPEMDSGTGEIVLPRAVGVPALPASAPPSLASAMKAAGADWSPTPAPGEAVHPGLPLAAPREAREAARAYAAEIGNLLSLVPEDEFVAEWLARWAPFCSRRSDQDYAGWQGAVALAVQDVPAIAFTEESAAAAAGNLNFKWLPSPAEVKSFLDGWLKPYRDAEARARKVAAAKDPEPRARGSDDYKPVANTSHRGRWEDKPRYLDPLHLAIRLQQELANGPVPDLKPALVMRLAAHLKRYPDVAEKLGLADEEAPA